VTVYPAGGTAQAFCAAPLVLLGRMGYNKITVAAVLPLAGEGHFRIVRSEELGVRSYL